MAVISMTREELMQKLLEAKAKADKEDAKAEAIHKREETAALAKFRMKLKEAGKWDYETAKKNYMSVRGDLPRCPVRLAHPIELAITQVKMDSRKAKFRLSSQSDWYRAATWVPANERPKQSVCD